MITKDRSPRAPAISLEEAISQIKRLQGQIGRSPVKPEVAARAMGYSGMTGSSLTLLAGLSQYGLVDRDKGMVTIAPLALKLLHPTSSEQQQEAIREAATAPEVFRELYAGYNECSEDVLSSHLIQNGFNLDRAKRVAKVYTANKAFAKLEGGSILPVIRESKDEEPPNPAAKSSDFVQAPHAPAAPVGAVAAILHSSLTPLGQKVLAQYTIPLGANQATLVFTGDELTEDDFDALSDFVEFSKKQFVRAQSKPKSILQILKATTPAPDGHTNEDS